MTPFSEMFSAFKNKIIDYDFLTLTEEEESFIMNARLKSALSKFKAKSKDIVADYTLEVFNRELYEEEIDALSYWLIYEWVTPRVNNIELFQHRLNTREFQGYSEANHLKELLEIKNQAISDAFYWTNQINSEKIKQEMRVKTNGL